MCLELVSSELTGSATSRPQKMFSPENCVAGHPLRAAPPARLSLCGAPPRQPLSAHLRALEHGRASGGQPCRAVCSRSALPPRHRRRRVPPRRAARRPPPPARHPGKPRVRMHSEPGASLSGDRTNARCRFSMKDVSSQSKVGPRHGRLRLRLRDCQGTVASASRRPRAAAHVRRPCHAGQVVCHAHHPALHRRAVPDPRAAPGLHPPEEGGECRQVVRKPARASPRLALCCGPTPRCARHASSATILLVGSCVVEPLTLRYAAAAASAI